MKRLKSRRILSFGNVVCICLFFGVVELSAASGTTDNLTSTAEPKGVVLDASEIEKFSREFGMRLSMQGESSAEAFQFELSIGVNDPLLTEPDSEYLIGPMVNEIAVDGDRLVIIVRTPDGLPYIIMTDRFLVACDRLNPGGLIYNDKGGVIWKLGKENFTFTYVYGGSELEFDLDLEGLLSDAVAKGRDVFYNETDKTISYTTGIATQPAVYEVILASESDWDFGVRSVHVKSNTSPDFLIEGFRPVDGSFDELNGISSDDLEGLGLEMRKLGDRDLLDRAIVPMIPKGFPRSREEREAAEILRKWINSLRGIEEEASRAPDLRETMARAEAGDPVAMNDLSIMYFSGQKVAQDYAEAARWAEAAAELGHVVAQSNIGIFYGLGLGVVQDDEKAVFWCRKAAEQGNSIGMLNLGSSYVVGKGVDQDADEGLAWLKKSAELGNAKAMKKIGWMFELGEGVAEDIDEAIAWYRKAAEQGDLWSQKALGQRYARGDGVDQNYGESFRLWNLAAEQGDAPSQYIVGVKYTEGNGVNVDKAKAIEWYRLSANQGFASAQLNLGFLLYDEQGDTAEVYRWLTLAAGQGEQKAKDALRLLFQSTAEEIIAEGKRRASEFVPKVEVDSENPDSFLIQGD